MNFLPSPITLHEFEAEVRNHTRIRETKPILATPDPWPLFVDRPGFGTKTRGIEFNAVTNKLTK